jgi:hypothetical protein
MSFSLGKDTLRRSTPEARTSAGPRKEEELCHGCRLSHPKEALAIANCPD